MLLSSTTAHSTASASKYGDPFYGRKRLQCATLLGVAVTKDQRAEVPRCHVFIVEGTWEMVAHNCIEFAQLLGGPVPAQLRGIHEPLGFFPQCGGRQWVDLSTWNHIVSLGTQLLDLWLSSPKPKPDVMYTAVAAR